MNKPRLPYDIVEEVETYAFSSEEEEFRKILESNFLGFKSTVLSQQLSFSKHTFRIYVEQLIYDYEKHLLNVNERFSDSSFPLVETNRILIKEQIEEVLSFLNSLTKSKNKVVSLNNFCAAVSLVLLNGGLKLEPPGTGRNSGKGDYVRFENFCRTLVKESPEKAIIIFNDSDLNQEQVISDLKIVLSHAQWKDNELSSKTKIKDYIKKAFGFYEVANESIKVKDIQLLLKGTSCESCDVKRLLISQSKS